MEVISKPQSVRGLGNVIDLHNIDDYVTSECNLTVDTPHVSGYQVLRLSGDE